MANVLSEAKRHQVLALGRLGWSLRRIEAETGVRRETASAYLKAAGVDVRGPRRRRITAAELTLAATDGAASDELLGSSTAKPASEVTTDPVAKPASEVTTGPPLAKPASEVTTDPRMLERPSASPATSACEPYRDVIEEAMRLGRNAMVIWQDLVDDHGFGGGYASVRRFVAKLRGCSDREAHPVLDTAPGEEAQVDYGSGPMVRDPETGKYRRTRLFVLTLAHSRKSVRLLSFRSSSKIWCQLHIAAFMRLGGTPRVMVLDNLREGVVRPDVYDPMINVLYREMLAHYGVIALPCRVRHPDRKGKVESGVDHGQEKLQGLRFDTLDDAQAYLDRWEERWADTRIHGTTKQQVAAMFASELPHLRALPLEPFRFFEFGRRRVHLDGFVEVRGAYYAPPHGWIGREVDVRWSDTLIRILDPKTGQLLREHLVARPGRRRIERRDLPRKTPASTDALLERARELGEHVGEVARAIHLADGEAPGVRRILGLIGLARRHGLPALERACGFALEQQTASYRFVRAYLEHAPTPPLLLRQIDPLIRDLTEYRALVERITNLDEGETSTP